MANQVAKDEQLLGTARDCFHFVTRFFEPINVSAAHIYHSALELSPEFSTVRMLHYDRRPTPFPRVAAGIADSWDSSIDIPKPHDTYSCRIWSPCGRFVTTKTQEAVEIWDSLTAELLSTLQPDGPTPRLKGTHAYSPDGLSLACASNDAIIIWDIQTGGAAKEIHLGASYDVFLVWSLDGGTICAMDWDWEGSYTVRRFNVVLGTEQSSITSCSRFQPHVWAHGKSFRVMTTRRRTDICRADCTIDIFEVGPALTKIESFDVQLGENDQDIGWEADWWIESFSPTTYRISLLGLSQARLLVLDIRDSGRLLDEPQKFDPRCCFSPDGGFFAAYQISTVHIWKYDGSSYVAWRKLPIPGDSHSLLFSPTSSSVLGALWDIIKVWHLDDLSVPPASHGKQLGVFSRSGAYLVTTSNRGNTITITDVLSRTPLQLIHTGIEICGLELTGNVLLVVGSEVAVAWLLTEEGLVNGVFGDRVAGPGDSIWTVPASPFWLFLFEGETAVIRSGDARHVYNTRTGETLELAPTTPDRGKYRLLVDVLIAQSHLYGGSMGSTPLRDGWDPLRNMTKGWVKDRGGRHLLWLPVEWRDRKMEWFSDVAIIQFRHRHIGKTVTVKLY